MNTPARKRPYKPEPSATNAPRQARLRARRKADGWRRVSIWLSPEQAGRLETLGGDAWLGRTVKTLLARSVAEPGRGKPAALFDAPSPVSGSGGDFSGTVKKGAGESAEPAKKGKAVLCSRKTRQHSWRKWTACYLKGCMVVKLHGSLMMQVGELFAGRPL